MADSNVDQTPSHEVTVTNNDIGPRYVHTARGMEVIAAGLSLATIMSATQIAAAKLDKAEGGEVDRFTIEGGDVADEADRSNLSVTALRKLAEEAGIQLKGRKDGDGKDLPDITSKPDLLTALEAHDAAQA